jgi:hypothetical protein
MSYGRGLGCCAGRPRRGSELRRHLLQSAWRYLRSGAGSSRNCNTHSCPVDCGGDWSQWSCCSTSCDLGSSTRTYVITTAAEYGGRQCASAGGAVQTKTCTPNICQLPAQSGVLLGRVTSVADYVEVPEGMGNQGQLTFPVSCAQATTAKIAIESIPPTANDDTRTSVGWTGASPPLSFPSSISTLELRVLDDGI